MPPPSSPRPRIASWPRPRRRSRRAASFASSWPAGAHRSGPNQLLSRAPADWTGWHLYFSDERCLPPDHDGRNSRAAARAWLDRVPIPAPNIHPIPAELGAEAAAAAYRHPVSVTLPFDLVTLGMGEDGHTASLFPGQVHPTAELTLPIHGAPKSPLDRVSLSARTLSDTREVMILVTGAEKRDPLAARKAGELLPVAGTGATRGGRPDRSGRERGLMPGKLQPGPYRYLKQPTAVRTMPVNPIGGGGYLLRGMRLIIQPGLRRFVLLPLLINILAFSAAIWYGISRFETFLARMESWIPSQFHWLDWVLWPLFVLVLVILVFYGFTLVANLLASPFNGLLAEKVELYLTSRPLHEGGGWKKALTRLVPTLLDELGKLLFATLVAVPFLILFLIPGINLAAPVLWFLLGPIYITSQGFCGWKEE